MRKVLYLMIVILMFLLAACGSDEKEKQNFSSVTKKSWANIESKAENTKVRIFMWGGDEGINQYMDEWVSPKLKEKYNLTLERVPMDTGEILQ
ncbi:ABC transporter substrate-binding protein, partial [Halobacillus sp. BBL2006]